MHNIKAFKGFKQGMLPSIVDFVGTFLVFIIAFCVKQPISTLMYENLPFLNFAGIFKGIIGINILFYEVIAYGLTIVLLAIIFGIVKRISLVFNKMLNATIVLTLPNKIIGAILIIFSNFKGYTIFICSFFCYYSKIFKLFFISSLHYK